MDSKSLFDIILEEKILGRDMIVKALKVVEGFIRDRGLMLYGGIAIDYALKMANNGFGIYSDISLPDYDFRSCFNYEDAISLADELYKAGYPNVQVINARHVTTRRIRTSYIWVADITYIPPELVDNIPTLICDGFIITHPDFQRCDLHSSLSFLLEGAPREVILHRYKKDIERLALIDRFYPVKIKGKPSKTHRYKCKPQGIITGMAALSYYFGSMSEQDGEIEFDAVEDKLSWCCVSSIEYDVMSDNIYLEPYLEVRPPTIITGSSEILFYVDKIVCYNETQTGIKVVSHHHLMLYFLARYFEQKSYGNKQASRDALIYYLKMFDEFKEFIKPSHATGQSENYSHKASQLDYRKGLGIIVDDIDRVPPNNIFRNKDVVFPSNEYAGYFYRMSGKPTSQIAFNNILRCMMPLQDQGPINIDVPDYIILDQD